MIPVIAELFDAIKTPRKAPASILIRGELIKRIFYFYAVLF
jgi:hypothetical protein